MDAEANEPGATEILQKGSGGDAVKGCPQCGFVPTPSGKALLKLYEKEFGAFPIYAMIKRGWFGVPGPDHGDIPAIEKCLFRFFDAKDEDEMWANIEAMEGRIKVNGVPWKHGNYAKIHAQPF